MEDAVQDVLMVVLRRLEDIHPGKERAFVVAVAAGVAANRRRRERRHPEDTSEALEEIAAAEELDAHGHAPPNGEQSVERSRRLAMLKTGLDAMTDAQRAVFVLFELEELTARQIAQQLGVSTFTVVSRTDAGAHPQVDDEAYLDRIVLDLARRGVIGGGNEVWLVGAGSGAVMALSAAAHHPDRYAGVAALIAERLDALPAGGLSGPRLGRRLERAIFVVQGDPADAWGAELEARSKEWALALGAPEGRTPGSPRRACASSCSRRASMRFHRRAALTHCRSRPRASGRVR